MYIEEDVDLIKLIEKKMTVGEANQRALDRLNRTEEEFTRVYKSFFAGLDKQHQDQVEQRQRFLMGIAGGGSSSSTCQVITVYGGSRVYCN